MLTPTHPPGFHNPLLLLRQEVFFTKNGRHLGVAFKDIFSPPKPGTSGDRYWPIASLPHGSRTSRTSAAAPSSSVGSILLSRSRNPARRDSGGRSGWEGSRSGGGRIGGGGSSGTNRAAAAPAGASVKPTGCSKNQRRGTVDDLYPVFSLHGVGEVIKVRAPLPPPHTSSPPPSPIPIYREGRCIGQ